MVVAGSWGRENGELVFNENSLFHKMKRVLELDGGGGCTTL